VDVEGLRIESLRGQLGYFAARGGLTSRFTAAGDGGLRALFAGGEGDEEVLFAVVPAGGGYLSLSLVLVVDEAFFHARIEEILAVTSRYEVCPSLSRDDRLEDGEVYLHLSVRLFLAPLTSEAFEMAVENLRASRAALAEAF
jgi:hypothetical protein